MFSRVWMRVCLATDVFVIVSIIQTQHTAQIHWFGAVEHVNGSGRSDSIHTRSAIEHRRLLLCSSIIYDSFLNATDNDFRSMLTMKISKLYPSSIHRKGRTFEGCSRRNGRNFGLGVEFQFVAEMRPTPRILIAFYPIIFHFRFSHTKPSRGEWERIQRHPQHRPHMFASVLESCDGVRNSSTWFTRCSTGFKCCMWFIFHFSVFRFFSISFFLYILNASMSTGFRWNRCECAAFRCASYVRPFGSGMLQSRCECESWMWMYLNYNRINLLVIDLK